MLQFPLVNNVPQTNDKLNERRIGFREGQGDASTLPNPTAQGDSSERINCLTSPGGCSSGIRFVIDSISRENPVAGTYNNPSWSYVPRMIVYAHFSFDHFFVQPTLGSPPKVYTVFFEGCCRPGTQGGTHDMVLLSGKGTPWHVRTEVVIGRDEAQYAGLPTSSFSFEPAMDIVQLPHGQNTNCQTKMTFFLQGYHPEDAFEPLTTYAHATENQMGLYKCLEHGTRNNPQSPLEPDKSTNNGQAICTLAETYRQELQRTRTGVVVNGITGRSIDYNIQNPGYRYVGIVASTQTQVPGENTQNIVLRTQVDFLVRVWETNNLVNDAPDQLTNLPPLPFYDPMLVGATANTAPTYDNPIKMECGKPKFMLNGYEEEYIRVRFRDADNGGACIQGEGLLHNQKLEWIGNTHTLPPGATMTQTMVPMQSRLWDQYVELRWQPKCEDRSTVGRFLFCFAAQDELNEGGANPILQTSLPAEYYPSFSYSSPARLQGPFMAAPAASGQCCNLLGSTECCNHVQNPSCLYVHVEPPKPNPTPPITAARGNNFNQPCLAPGVCNATTPCAGQDQSVVVEQVFELEMFSMSENDLLPLDLVVTFQDAAGNTVGTPTNMNVTKFYGCNGEWGAPGCSATRDEDNQNDVAVQIRYGAPRTVAEATFDKICVQGRQLLDDVDEEAWVETWGFAPNNDTCQVCFRLVVVDKPSFFGATQPRESNFDVRIGEERSLDIIGRGRLNRISILVLPDPGAPIGSSLTEQQIAQEPTFWTVQRTFRFAPQVGQEGQVFRVCFVVRNEDDSGSRPLYSDALCWNFRVPKLTLGWTGIGTGPESRSCEWAGERPCCPTTTVQPATVGCTQHFDVVATKYNFADQQRYTQGYPVQPFFFVQHPACTNPENCPIVLSVQGCGEGVTGPCCGNGVCDGAETGSNCPADCEPDTVSLVTETDENEFQQGSFSFSPNRQQQGRTLLVCIGAEPAAADGGAAVIVQERQACYAPSLCFIFRVDSCKYCVPQGKTLKSIARHYFLNVDWLRLYNSNPAVRDPDGLLTEEVIQVGPLYTVQSGDTLLSIAAKTRTTVRSLMENNPALPPDGMIQPDDRICVLVCSAA